MKIFLRLVTVVFLIAFLTNCSYVRPVISLSTGLRLSDFYEYGYEEHRELRKNKRIVYKERKGKALKYNLLCEGVPRNETDNSNENSVKNPPPGVLWTGKKDLYIDQIERTNLDWQEFLAYIKQDSSKEYYLSMVPDVEVIKLQERDFYQPSHKEQEPYRSYFLHPDYLYFPVVGISHYQASEYCKWRGQLMTDIYKQYRKKGEAPVKITFRLPTEAEWEAVESAGINISTYPHGFSQLDLAIEIQDEFVDYALNKIERKVSREQLLKDIHAYNETDPRALVVNCKTERPYFLQFRTPASAFSGVQNLFDTYNMIGNVAEMVAEKGIAKGGSWKHTLEESKITDRITYSGPNDHVGFRCMCETEKIN